VLRMRPVGACEGEGSYPGGLTGSRAHLSAGVWGWLTFTAQMPSLLTGGLYPKEVLSSWVTGGQQSPAYLSARVQWLMFSAQTLS
jgi:hypothetical protein